MRRADSPCIDFQHSSGHQIDEGDGSRADELRNVLMCEELILAVHGDRERDANERKQADERSRDGNTAARS